jgi:hypothetical protein
MTEKELIRRVQMMRAGDSTIYFTGNLSEEAYRDQHLASLRNTAQRLSDMRMVEVDGSISVGMGLVTLTQRRVGSHFAYIATKLK